jgi:hypothetical protein
MVGQCTHCGEPETNNGVTSVSLTPVHHCDPRNVRKVAIAEAAGWLRASLNPDRIADARWDTSRQQRERLADDMLRRIDL